MGNFFVSPFKQYIIHYCQEELGKLILTMKEKEMIAFRHFISNVRQSKVKDSDSPSYNKFILKDKKWRWFALLTETRGSISVPQFSRNKLPNPMVRHARQFQKDILFDKRNQKDIEKYLKKYKSLSCSDRNKIEVIYPEMEDHCTWLLDYYGMV